MKGEREMIKKDRHHLTLGGTFQSDKYPWCPPGFVPLKMSDEDAVRLLHEHAFLFYHEMNLPGTFVLVSLEDPIGRALLKEYAPIRAKVDADFGRDLLEAIENHERKCGNCGGPDASEWCSDCKKKLCDGCAATDPHNEDPDSERMRRQQEYEDGTRTDRPM